MQDKILFSALKIETVVVRGCNQLQHFSMNPVFLKVDSHLH